MIPICLTVLDLFFYVKLDHNDSFQMRFYFYGRKRIHNFDSFCCKKNRRHTLCLKPMN